MRSYTPDLKIRKKTKEEKKVAAKIPPRLPDKKPNAIQALSLRHKFAKKAVVNVLDDEILAYMEEIKEEKRIEPKIAPRLPAKKPNPVKASLFRRKLEKVKEKAREKAREKAKEASIKSSNYLILKRMPEEKLRDLKISSRGEKEENVQKFRAIYEQMQLTGILSHQNRRKLKLAEMVDLGKSNVALAKFEEVRVKFELKIIEKERAIEEHEKQVRRDYFNALLGAWNLACRQHQFEEKSVSVKTTEAIEALSEEFKAALSLVDLENKMSEKLFSSSTSIPSFVIKQFEKNIKEMPAATLSSEVAVNLFQKVLKNTLDSYILDIKPEEYVQFGIMAKKLKDVTDLKEFETEVNKWFVILGKDHPFTQHFIKHIEDVNTKQQGAIFEVKKATDPERIQFKGALPIYRIQPANTELKQTKRLVNKVLNEEVPDDENNISAESHVKLVKMRKKLRLYYTEYRKYLDNAPTEILTIQKLAFRIVELALVNVNAKADALKKKFSNKFNAVEQEFSHPNVNQLFEVLRKQDFENQLHSKLNVYKARCETQFDVLKEIYKIEEKPISFAEHKNLEAFNASAVELVEAAEKAETRMDYAYDRCAQAMDEKTQILKKNLLLIDESLKAMAQERQILAMKKNGCKLFMRVAINDKLNRMDEAVNFIKNPKNMKSLLNKLQAHPFASVNEKIKMIFNFKSSEGESVMETLMIKRNTFGESEANARAQKAVLNKVAPLLQAKKNNVSSSITPHHLHIRRL